jgi:sulfite reductase (ferredoxin)
MRYSPETAVTGSTVEGYALVTPQGRRSAVEGFKESSRQLRGTLAQELAGGCDHLGEQSKNLIKFHGSYQQEDRDARKQRSHGSAAKQYQFMVRCKIPGGRLTAAQYLAVDDLAGRFANATLRLTTRQGIQLHGVLTKNLKRTIAGINECLLTTLGACGDVNRNVMTCPAPHADHGIHAELQEAAARLAAQFAPRTGAYHEIWLDGQPLATGNETTDDEPVYGKTYLPRKFKMGLALPEDNCIDVFAQDLGFVAVVANDRLVGFNVLAGGGMGMTHGNANTFPHLAQPVAFVPAEELLPMAEAVITLFRDHGNRGDRKRARLKYLVHDWGVPMFRKALARYFGKPLQEPLPIEVRGFETHLGWQPQGNGQCYYGISIANGRIQDDGAMRLSSALRFMIELDET